MSYTLLKDLIVLVEEYEHKNSSKKIEDFIIWLNNKLFSPNIRGSHAEHEELLIAFKIMHLNKEMKKQAKAVLIESKLSSVDEYSFLLHLNLQESFRKMEIIEIHNLEAPTGIEIIKRLLKNGFVQEFADIADKRAKRIKITAKGRKELNMVKPKFDKVFYEFSKSISTSEKIQINGILNKLIGA